MFLQSKRALTFFALGFALAFVCPLLTHAQSPQPPATPLTAPPPLKVISKEERQQLTDAKDTKERLKLSIEFASGHLSRAEKLTMQTEYEAASAEIGMYHALIEDALENLSALRQDSNKTRDLYKRLELQLRGDGPRLTSMRRVTPLEFAVWIKKVEDFAREGRTEALNSFYGHTVVREKTNLDKPEDKPKETPTPQTPKTNQP